MSNDNISKPLMQETDHGSFLERELQHYHCKMRRYAKAHYEAADRKIYRDRWLRAAIVMLSILVISLQGLRVDTGCVPDQFINLSTVIGGALVATVSMLQFLLNYGEAFYRHRAAARNYSECRQEIEDLYDKHLKKEDFDRTAFERLKKRMGVIGSQAPSVFPHIS